MLRRQFFKAFAALPLAAKAAEKSVLEELDDFPPGLLGRIADGTVTGPIPPTPWQKALQRARAAYEAREEARDDRKIYHPYWVREKKSWSSAFKQHVHMANAEKRAWENRRAELWHLSGDDAGLAEFLTQKGFKILVGDDKDG